MHLRLPNSQSSLCPPCRTSSGELISVSRPIGKDAASKAIGKDAASKVPDIYAAQRRKSRTIPSWLVERFSSSWKFFSTVIIHVQSVFPAMTVEFLPRSIAV